MIAAFIPFQFIVGRFHNAVGLGVFFGVLALYWVVVTIKEKWVKIRTRHWLVTQALAENIRVEKVDGGMNGADYWKLTFDYTWTVTESHTASYSFNLVTEKLRNYAEAGMVGKSVAVHYDPKDETKAVLWFDEVWDLW